MDARTRAIISAPPFSPARIWAMCLRYLYLLRSSWPRTLELVYWPTLQMIVWGFMSQFMATQSNWVAKAFGVFLAAVMLWDVFFRGQLGVSISFLEEIWSRNLGHVFVSPLRPYELVAALIAMSFIRVCVGVLPATLVAWLLYAFDIYALGPILILFVVNLMVMGWWIALGVVSLLLRYGAGAEALAWSVLFGLTPFSAVFYPISALPAAVQPIAQMLPSAHVFEGMRAAIATGAIAWDQLDWAAGLNVVWTVLGVLLFIQQFRAARVRGALLSIGE